MPHERAWAHSWRHFSLGVFQEYWIGKLHYIKKGCDQWSHPVEWIHMNPQPINSQSLLRISFLGVQWFLMYHIWQRNCEFQYLNKTFWYLSSCRTSIWFWFFLLHLKLTDLHFTLISNYFIICHKQGRTILMPYSCTLFSSM